MNLQKTTPRRVCGFPRGTDAGDPSVSVDSPAISYLLSMRQQASDLRRHEHEQENSYEKDTTGIDPAF